MSAPRTSPHPWYSSPERKMKKVFSPIKGPAVRLSNSVDYVQKRDITFSISLSFVVLILIVSLCMSAYDKAQTSDGSDKETIYKLLATAVFFLFFYILALFVSLYKTKPWGSSSVLVKSLGVITIISLMSLFISACIFMARMNDFSVGDSEDEYNQLKDAGASTASFSIITFLLVALLGGVRIMV